MTPEDLLTRTLREVVETTDYPSTSVSTVAARSRRVRHGRRRATTLVAAAAAVGLVGVSAAVWLNHDPSSSRSPSGHLNPASSLPDVPQGAAPKVAFLDADVFVTAGGDRITSPMFRKAQTATPYGNGVLVVGPSTSQRPFATISLVSGGSTTRVGCGVPRLALGDEAPAYWLSGTCGVDVRSGQLVVGTTSTNTVKGVIYALVRSTGAGLVAQLDSLVLRRATGPVVVAPDGSFQRIPHLANLAAASPSGDLLTGFNSVGDAVVVDAATGAVRWRARTWSLGHFSQSGRYVVGTQSLGVQTTPGVGDVVGIWDAATGRQVTSTVLPNMTIVGTPVWEGDDSVVVVAQDRNDQQAIVRIDLNGTITRATAVAPQRQGSFRLAAAP